MNCRSRFHAQSRTARAAIPFAPAVFVLAMEQRRRSHRMGWRWHDRFSGSVEKDPCGTRPDGLPPFHAVVLLLAACLSDWRGSPSHLGRFSRTLADWTQARSVAWKRRLIWQLDAISSLTSDRRSSTEARTTLAKAVFEFEPGVLFDYEAAAIINLLEGSATKLFRNRPRSGHRRNCKSSTAISTRSISTAWMKSNGPARSFCLNRRRLTSRNSLSSAIF